MFCNDRRLITIAKNFLTSLGASTETSLLYLSVLQKRFIVRLSIIKFGLKFKIELRLPDAPLGDIFMLC